MIHETLTKFFFYYRLLSSVDKERFEKRVKEFIQEKEFHSRLKEPIPEEVKILVGATAIQVTFGLRKFKLPHFKVIIIYPDKYFNRITGRYHKGEVNLKGGIVFSLKDFLHGIRHPFDKYNLGIHEFAHALYFENFIRNEDYLMLDRREMDNWHRLAGRKIIAIRNNMHELIREYAATNKQEFFAVCTEYFFEAPSAFRSHLPELYHSMSRLLNQDPALQYGDIEVKKAGNKISF